MVVMRALAKDPAERYQTAEEMEADLRRVNRGVVDLARTEEAATAIISRPPPTAVTEITLAARRRRCRTHRPRVLRLRRAAPACRLALDRRPAVRCGGDRRRLLPLQPDPEQLLERRSPWRTTAASARSTPFGRSARRDCAPRSCASSTRAPRDVRLQAGSTTGRADREGQLCDDLLLGRPAADRRAERRRREARPGSG